MAIINRKGDKGSPCLRPLSAGKKNGEPGGFNTEFNPLEPCRARTYLSKSVDQEVPIKMFIGFFNI